MIGNRSEVAEYPALQGTLMFTSLPAYMLRRLDNAQSLKILGEFVLVELRLTRKVNVHAPLPCQEQPSLLACRESGGLQLRC